MVYIFVSHSRHDTEIVHFFVKAIGRINGLNHKLMELEDLEDKYAGNEIANTIRNECAGLIVLLGKNIYSPPGLNPEYIRAWVTFEVGVAAGCGKRVWVFEEYDAENIPFPIPLVSDFFRYNLDNDHLRWIGEALEAGMLGNARPPGVIECPFCHAMYYFWSRRNTMHCPVCRQQFNPAGTTVKQRSSRYDFTPSNIV